MALGPKQMGEAILRNLKDKTGKTVEEWIELLKKEKLQHKKEIITFLKTKNQLGHFQTMKVFEYFNGIDHYKDPSTFAAQIFDSKNSKELYKFTKSKILDLAEDIRVQPCKTYIPFYRKNQFAILTKTKDDKLLLGLNLPFNEINKRFSSKSTKGSIRINAQTIIENKSDFDEVIKVALLKAYEKN